MQKKLDRRRKTVLLVALAPVILIVFITPNVLPPLLAGANALVNPFRSSYDMVVSIPSASNIVLVPIGSNGIQSGFNGLQSELSGLAAIYEDIKLMPVQSDVSLSVRLERNVVPVGDNVTFTVTISWKKTATTGLALMVFLVDPNSVVRGAYPDGKIPFDNPTASAINLDTETRNSMQNGRLAFTFAISDTPLSTGTWNVYVLAARELSGNQFYAWTATSFMVTEPPQLTNLLVAWFAFGVGSVGTFSTVYRIVDTHFDSLTSARRWFMENKYFLAGFFLIAAYLALYAYLVLYATR